MESKDIMELIDRLLAANDQVTELLYKIDAVQSLMHEAQEAQAEARVTYCEDKEMWTLDGASVTVKALQKVLGFYDSKKALQILKDAKNA